MAGIHGVIVIESPSTLAPVVGSVTTSSTHWSPATKGWYGALWNATWSLPLSVVVVVSGAAGNDDALEHEPLPSLGAGRVGAAAGRE